MPHRGGRASAASERRSLRLALRCPHPLSSMAILVYVAERGKEAARDTHRREALGCGEGVRNPGVLWKNIPSWQVILWEGQLWPLGGLWPDSSGHASLFPLGVSPPEQSPSVFAESSVGKPGLPPACSSVCLPLPVWEPLSERAEMCILLLWSHDHKLCWEEEVRWHHPPP